MSRIHERLAVLAQPIRTRMLRLLELEELAVGEVARVVQLPQSTVSRHLKELREAGWVSARKDGTATLLALSADLGDDAVALWELVRAGTDGEDAEDGLRLAAVLAARAGDSRRFFGRVAGQWAELRREMFGDAFFLPTLTAMLPGELVVADLGCGTGEALAVLAPNVARVIGVDREPAMLDAARRRLEGMAHVELRQGDLHAPPLEEAEVDVALTMLVLHHVEALEATIRAVAKALRPGGRWVLLDMVAHDRRDYRRTMGHVHLGFEEAAVTALAEDAGLRCRQWRVLRPSPEASGPALFLAVFERA
jgi:ArsR family transcriptional regulator